MVTQSIRQGIPVNVTVEEKERPAEAGSHT
jgi:hypothetical protein